MAKKREYKKWSQQQYTHAAIWAMIAELMLDRKKEAFEIYEKINPIERTSNEDRLLKYKVEPYVVAGDIYSEKNLAGRGGWTWYTGSSAWLYEAQIRYILGIQIYHEKIKITPNVPDDWKQFEVKLKWKKANYKIKYYNLGLEKAYINEIKDYKESENKDRKVNPFSNEKDVERKKEINQNEKFVDDKKKINQSQKNVDGKQINNNEKIVEGEKNEAKSQNSPSKIDISNEKEEIELKPEGSYLIEVKF